MINFPANEPASKILRLVYACTNAERDEAQTLSLRKQIGGGSKRRTRLILYMFMLAAVLLLYLQIRIMVSAPWRPYVYVAALVFFIVFMFWKRRSRKEATSTNQLEVSEKEIAIVAPPSRVALPWSSFRECLESPTLFVLVDRTKYTLLVLPKRVFPDESSQTWFRELATHRAGPTGPPPMESPVLPRSASKDSVTIHFQLRYRDYLDRTLASWRTWGMLWFMVMIFLFATLYTGANPPPHPVYSTTQVLFLFMIPILLVVFAVATLISSIYTWRVHVKFLIPQQMAFSEESIAFAGSDGSGNLPWEAYTRYKETRWSFILWGRDQAWLLLPKRSFASTDDLVRLRALLGRQLRQSRWFFG